MINSSELRLNNWVMFEGRYFQIECLAKDMPFLNTDEFGVGVVTYKNIEPIPLSPDKLLKLGFLKEILEGDECYYSLKLSNNKDEDLSLLSGDKNGICEVFLFPYDTIRFQYIHQIQNVVHLLKNKELIINF